MTTARGGLERFINHVLEVADQALASEQLESLDADLVRNGQQDLAVHVQELLRVIDIFVEDGEPELAEFAHQCLWNILSGVYLIGSHTAMTASAKRKFKPEFDALKTEAMRICREEKERAYKTALDHAIHQEVDGLDPRPSEKVIHARVNRRLKDAGLKPASPTTVWRRLKGLDYRG